ncbi:MAG: hypothetical protein RI572_05815 [Salegentibacter sp.]|uniref:Uncharacterized protein n=1 Tax=Salegentibacter flavus TaxID=287099 RepID=A0A1I4Y8R0_9FLAO|nr:MULTISPECIES: hypothetical protein [Salegentibacter]MDR9456909.1 hypothetical protein [Salegentibacter sp.]SFN34395.1 hypothetical protein SAMN05660413_00621 [Salegentibacter flavus]
MTNNEQPTTKRNIWNLILGIAFTGYGSYRLYYHMNSVETDTFGLVLAIAFVGLGIYDLYKYFAVK